MYELETTKRNAPYIFNQWRSETNSSISSDLLAERSVRSAANSQYVSTRACARMCFRWPMRRCKSVWFHCVLFLETVSPVATLRRGRDKRREMARSGLEGKVKSFSAFNDCNGGGDDQIQNRQKLEIENILVLRNARQPLNNVLHSTTLPVDAIN